MAREGILTMERFQMSTRRYRRHLFVEMNKAKFMARETSYCELGPGIREQHNFAFRSGEIPKKHGHMCTMSNALY